jgi:hypothetical protein
MGRDTRDDGDRDVTNRCERNIDRPRGEPSRTTFTRSDKALPVEADRPSGGAESVWYRAPEDGERRRERGA